MVELEPTEAVVRDPEAGEDAVLVAGPDVGPHGRRDRIAPCDVPALVGGVG